MRREIWDRVLIEGVDGIASPQPSGRFARGSWLPQLAPLVPEVAAHGCVVGAKRSRGNPANLFFVTLLRGVGATKARELSKRLAMALAVDTTDDVFARFVEDQLRLVPPPYRPVTLPSPGNISREAEAYFIPSADGATPSPVAARFCEDLEITISLKEVLTRRQWTVLLETLLRLGLGMQILWTCRANEIVWRFAADIIRGNAAPSEAELTTRLWKTEIASDPLLEAGAGVGPSIRSRLGRYARARVGLNALLVGLDEGSVGWPGAPLGLPVARGPSTSATALRDFLVHVERNRESIKNSPLDEASAVSPGWIACTSGFNRNTSFFLLYGMGQLSPARPEFEGYDESFVLAKKGASIRRDGRPDRRRWIVKLGPSALVALVHACCQSQAALSATMDDFKRHLGEYGLRAEGDELKTGIMGHDLQRLGLVVDSPDAGGGRLLVDPITEGS